MSEWQETPLSQLVTFQKGRKVDTSSHSRAGYARYLGASGIRGHSDGFAATKFAVVAKEADLLMLWDGERSGLVGCGQSGVVASTVCRLSPTEKIHPKFLYFALAHSFDWIQNRRTGSGVPHVPKEIGRILRVPHPKSLSAQKRIAAILSSLDTAIGKTEALIEKHQQIKAGLMHDLFTRGVLPNGQLRSPREQAPELYRETPIGWFPKEWTVETLEALLAPVPNSIRSGPFGSALLKNELVETGIPFLGIDNIHVERFEASFKRFVSERKFRELSRYRVLPGDVVITIMGTVGRCCVTPNDLEIALSSKHLWTMTFDVMRVVPALICWQLNHAEWAKAWFRRSTQGGIMDAIQSSTLKTLRLTVPRIEEQRRIFERYRGTQHELDSTQEQLAKLQQEKLGLMQDLLTGKVPVKVEASAAEAADA
jgi:type I restriction enzyme, S subunit